MLEYKNEVEEEEVETETKKETKEDDPYRLPVPDVQPEPKA